MSTLALSLVQTTTHWHDPKANRDHFEALFKDLPDNGDLVVLPEMFATGFTMASSTQAEPMDGPTVVWLQSMARRYARTFCGSLVIRDAKRIFNRLLWVSPDGAIAHYDKRHRFRMADEHEHYHAGAQKLIVSLGTVRVCPLVCYDLRFPVWSRNRDDYDLLLYVANWPAARQLAWRRLLPARAIENQCYVAAVNVVGVDGGGVSYAGGSSVWDPEGRAVIDLGAAASIANVTLDFSELTTYREQFPAWQDRDDFTLNVDNGPDSKQRQR
ncbi:MAG: amidohydrolase [Pseudomonadales bacterium]